MPGAYLGCKATTLKCCLALAGCVEVQDTQPVRHGRGGGVGALTREG